MVLFFVILALVFVLVLVIVSNIVIVPQSKVYVIERLGSYRLLARSFVEFHSMGAAICAALTV